MQPRVTLSWAIFLLATAMGGLLSGCTKRLEAPLQGATPISQIALPRFLGPTSPNVNRIALTARMDGTLVIEDGCLRVRTPSGGALIIWPASSELTRQNNRVGVRDRLTGTTIFVGDSVSLSGGFIYGTPDIDSPIPVNCQRPYFGAGRFAQKR